VPLEEACALEGLGQSHLADGDTGQAAAHLRQALTIYQRTGTPGARRVQETLRRNGLSATTPEPQPEPPSAATTPSSMPLTKRRSPNVPTAQK